MAGGIVASWISDHSEELTAALSIVLALLAVLVLNRVFAARGRTLAEAVVRGELPPEVDTRLRFLRRLLYALIIVVGLAVALSQFTGLSKLATSVLASGAIAAAVIGFAARQTLANFVAGVMIAITQPIRVGDWIAFEDHYGVVEDVRLNATILRTGADARIVIPNERIASGVLRNDSLVSSSVGLDVDVWIPPGADAGRAVTTLEEESGGGVSVAEAVPWGVRLTVGGDPVHPAERYGAEADLRARCLARLRAEGLLGQDPAP
jgi:small conductance mechanosensitive channel